MKKQKFICQITNIFLKIKIDQFQQLCHHSTDECSKNSLRLQVKYFYFFMTRKSDFNLSFYLPYLY